MTTNAQLVRLEAGDRGTPVRDVTDGDGASVEFYLSAPPLVGNSQVVKVGTGVKTEGADYTVVDDTGQLVFTVPPTTGLGNVVVTYQAVRLPDSAIDEACRQYGLVASATVEPGPPAAVLQAAAMVCDWLAADAAQDFDFDTDGQSYRRGSTAGAFANQAALLRARVQQAFGIVSLPMTRLDGYARRGQYSTRDLGATSAQNPRRTFYGSPDAPF